MRTLLLPGNAAAVLDIAGAGVLLVASCGRPQRVCASRGASQNAGRTARPAGPKLLRAPLRVSSSSSAWAEATQLPLAPRPRGVAAHRPNSRFLQFAWPESAPRPQRTARGLVAMGARAAARAGSAAPVLLLALALALHANGASASAATTSAALNGTGYCLVAPAFDVQETSSTMFIDIAGARAYSRGPFFKLRSLPTAAATSRCLGRRRARRFRRAPPGRCALQWPRRKLAKTRRCRLLRCEAREAT